MTVYRMGRPAAKGKAKAKPKPKPARNDKRLSDQAIAAGVVRAYRSQELCLYKDADGKVIRRPVTGDDLATMLERFAVTGSFQMLPARAKLHEAEMMRERLQEMTRNRVIEGKPSRWLFDDAREYLAEIFDCAIGTVHSPKRLQRLREAVAQFDAAIVALQKGGTILK